MVPSGFMFDLGDTLARLYSRRKYRLIFPSVQKPTVAQHFINVRLMKLILYKRARPTRILKIASIGLKLGGVVDSFCSM